MLACGKINYVDVNKSFLPANNDIVTCGPSVFNFPAAPAAALL